MSIPYKRQSDVMLGDRISTVLINKILNRLVANDNSVLPSTYKIPYVWEATWFNNPLVEGYKKGDAVWINTENYSDFIVQNKDRIYSYLYNNPDYKDRIVRCGDDWKRQYEIYMEVIKSGKLYWLGDIKQPAQIRVCKQDTRTTPDDDRFWEDFFVVRDDDKTRIQVLKEFQRITDEQFENHLSAYHPESYTSFKLSDYMMNDFSNASNVQKYNKTSIRNMSGFDSILKFVCKRYGDNNLKWFRIWKSGYLEHGGIIDINDVQGGDSVYYGDSENKMFTVSFDWKYDENLAAPIFDYQSTSMENFHFADSYISLGDNNQSLQEKIPYDDVSELGDTPRYFLSLTPRNTGEQTYKIFNQKYGYYNTKEVMSMKNKSFTFIINQDCRYYSYYASGFTINIAKRF